MANRHELLTVVVPFYNEGATVLASIERLMKTDLALPIEVIAIDDGSSDGGAETLAELVDSGSVRLLRHPTNMGKGAALRTGIDNAQGDVLTVLDADLEVDPSDFAHLLSPLLDGEANVVYGVREFGSHTSFSFWYVVGNWIVNFWASFLFNTWLADVYTCFKMADTETWRALDLRSKGFDVEAETTAKLLRSGNVIYEVPISYRARSREAGKKIRWTDGLKAIVVLARLRLIG